MKGLCCAVILAGLSIILDNPAVQAQERRPWTDGRGATEALRSQEAALEREAERWAARRDLPRRIVQRDGRLVELVGAVDGRPVYLRSLNGFAADITGASSLYPGASLGLSLTGAGMRVGIWDGGHVLQDHDEFLGRVSTGDEATVDDHATHVAGTLAAAGVRPAARGMAYEADLLSYDWSGDASEMSAEAGAGLLVSNHSYGSVAGWYYGSLEEEGEEQWYWLGDSEISTSEDIAFGRYDSEAVQFDAATAANPFLLPVVAAGNDRADRGPVSGTYRGLDQAGNWRTYDVATAPRARDGGSDGFDTIVGASVAKNVLTVGSISVDQAGRAGDASWFSSFGPTDDGRLKPDLIAPGENLLSAVSDGANAYGYSTGTSMAAPTVAGAALLLQQHTYDVSGSHLTAAALKGLLLHTARDVHLPGPDYATGWGMIDAASAAERLTAWAADPALLQQEVLVEGATFSSTVSTDQGGPLRVTLSWTDPPGTRRPIYGPQSLDDATAHLVNDLDLRLVGPEGTIYQPYRLDPARPGEEAQLGDNTADPVEQVFVAQAPPGQYSVIVTHKGELEGRSPQAFAVIVSGAHGLAVPLAVSHMSGEITEDRIVLTWKTRFEREAGSFAVERAPLTYRPNGDREVGLFEQSGRLNVGGASEKGRDYRFEDPRALAGRYQYRVVFERDDVRWVAAEVEVHVPPPDERAILSNYPNPFRDRTTVVLDLPRAQQVSVEIYDALGRRMRLLHDGEMRAGRHYLQLDADTWAPGIYFARISATGGILTHRMVVSR